MVLKLDKRVLGNGDDNDVRMETPDGSDVIPFVTESVVEIV